MSSRSHRPYAEPPSEWAPLEPEPAGGAAGAGEKPAPPVRALGIPLTDTMPFSSADGMRWVAYVEGFQREAPRFPPRTLLPGRRVRFDSDAGSWVSLEVPAGAPFLSEEQLRELLRCAQPFPPPALPARASRRAIVRRWVVEQVLLGVRWGRALAGEALHYWQQDRARAAARLHLAMARIRRRG